ncbi:MAG TPA: hypothetical protein VMR70_01330 [Flavisolibacter sp.]|nr:hypothetical protein [Flavisolibacter sp.]
MINIERTVLVRNNCAATFAFIANPANDHLWRKEINRTELKGELQVGVLAYEYSKLSAKKPDNLIVLACTEFVKNETVTFESVKDERFYLKSIRSVKFVTENETAVTYHLQFDPGIVKYALGLSLPVIMVKMKAASDMKKYLRKLTSLLEVPQERM